MTKPLVVANRRILGGEEPIYYVLHSADGHWEFHPRDHLDAPHAELLESTPAAIQRLDATVNDVLDLPPGWHAWRQAPDVAWERSEVPRGPTFFVLVEARPSPTHPDHERYRGAFISAWIRCGAVDEARTIAREALASDGWEVFREEEAREVDTDPGDEAQQYFRQAQLDGAVFVFDTYMVEFLGDPGEDAGSG